MEKKEYMNEGLDLRRLLLVLGRRLWLVLLGTLLGALMGAAVYFLVTRLTDGEPLYRASSEYYISFNFGEFEHGDDYFNAYTWDGILRGDQIVDYALTLLPETVTKEQVKAAVTGEMLGDYRILTVHVNTADAELTKQIAEAYHESMVHFGEEIDMLDHIEVWSRGEVEQVEKHTKAPSAAFLGGLIGALVSLFGVLLYLILEDAVYVEEEAARRFGLPVFGTLTQKKDKKQEELYQTNIRFVFGEKKISLWRADQLPDKEDYEALRKAEVLLLAIPWGKKAGAATRHLLNQLALQQCRPEGIVLVEAKDSFVKAYYGRKS
ncbi:MAG: hypothetical protein IJP31_10255 [Lachnospiraceae bacterium]|nr:hypothetical protein [Lachnospiraceae bacterium]